MEISPVTPDVMQQPVILKKALEIQESAVNILNESIESAKEMQNLSSGQPGAVTQMTGKGGRFNFLV